MPLTNNPGMDITFAIQWRLNRTDNFDESMLLSQVQRHKSELEDHIVDQARKLLESVIIGEMHWILVTRFDIFVSNDESLDDCAQK